MLDRCYRETHTDYHSYGGRGITVCDRWLESFVSFLEDMGERTSRSMTIERIDTNGNYEPGNCRWATMREQCRNARRNRILEFNGERLTMVEWSERIGINYGTLIQRIHVRGWPVDKALTAPVQSKYAGTSNHRSCGS